MGENKEVKTEETKVEETKAEVEAEVEETKVEEPAKVDMIVEVEDENYVTDIGVDETDEEAKKIKPRSISNGALDQIMNFMGRKSWNLLSTATVEEWRLIYALNLNLHEAFFIKGNKRILDLIRVYIDFLRARTAASMSYFSITEFSKKLMSEDEDDYSEAMEDREVLVLRAHGERYGTAKMESWMACQIIDRAASRNVSKLGTIILSERSFYEIETNPEFQRKVASSDYSDLKPLKPVYLSSTEGSNYNNRRTNTQGTNQSGEAGTSSRTNTTIAQNAEAGKVKKGYT